jgi:hypothetical protein
MADTRSVDYDLSRPQFMEFVLDGFVRAGSLVLAGAPGVGKTSLVVPLAATVAHLTNLKELTPTLRRRVYYVTEDYEQCVRMLRGMRLMKILTAGNEEVKDWFRIIPSARTTPGAWAAALEDLLKGAATRQEFPTGPYEVQPLVVLDTVAANLDLADENNNAEVSKAVAAVRKGVGPASVWMISHTAKALKRADPEDMSARGAGAWTGDTQGEAWIFSDDDQPGYRFIRLGKRRFDADYEEMRVSSRVEEEKVAAPWGEQTVRYRVADVFERYTQEERKAAKARKSDEQKGSDNQARMMSALAKAKKALESCEGEGLALQRQPGRHPVPAGYDKWSMDDILVGDRSSAARAQVLDLLVEKFRPGDDGAFYLFKKIVFGMGGKK